MMGLLLWFYWILFWFSFSWAEKNISIQFENQKFANFGIESREKRYIDLEIYSNLTELYSSKINNDEEIVNICEENEKDSGCRCIDNQVDCANLNRNLNVKAIKENFNAEIIIIFNSNISLEKNKIFPTNVETIERFIIVFTVINQIEDGAFDGFSSLKTLEFKYLNVKDINENILTQQLGKTLKKFAFTYTRKSKFDPSIFKNLVNLEELDLTGNDKMLGGKILHQFPESLSKLKILNLKYCYLIDLNENIFDNLRNLEHLDLEGSGFTSFPTAINVLSNLKLLNIGDNSIVKFEKNSFKGNPNLENLLAHYSNKLKSIEDCAFCNLQHLKIVDFSVSKHLSKIDENAFGSISNGYAPDILKFLMEDCNISVLPEKLLDWNKVQTLTIYNNPFACNCSNAWLFNDLLSNNSVYESSLSDGYFIHDYHPKYSLGCLGPPPTTPNHTIPLNITEIFAFCKTPNENNSFWIFIIFGVIAVIFIAVFVGIYSNRSHLTNYYRNIIDN